MSAGADIIAARDPRAWRERERGTAILEFMIVAPLLFLLVFAGAELSRLVQHHETLIKTVRNAARYVASETAGSLGVIVLTSDLIDDARNLAVYGNTGASGEPVLPGFVPTHVTVMSIPASQHIQVTANYTYQPLWGGTIPTFVSGGGAISLSLPMTATTIMRSL